MPNEELDEFLKDGAPVEQPETPPAPVPEQPPAQAPETPPSGEEEVLDGEGEQPDRNVPLKALQAERKERQDWKEKALRMEGELAALRVQAEAAAKVPPAAPVQQAPVPPQFDAPPNPAEDPMGFARWQQQIQWHTRANMSEAAVRADKSITDLDDKISIFKEAAATNPALQQALMLQADPYRWAYDQGNRIASERTQAAEREAAMKEIGDPAAYREKIRQEIMAELQPQAPVRQAPPPPPFQSLANGRSVQGRGVPTPPDISDEALFPNF